MESNIFRYIWRFSKRQQLVLLVVTLFSFPFLYYTLDLPKVIVNEAIGGRDFPKNLFGIELGQISYLLSLCGLFLLLVLINGGFKLWINIYRGVMGERMLRRLRFILIDRVLRFPLRQFRKISQGELIAMIISEVEPLGGYIGEAVSLPIFQGGTLLTILVFIMIQDPFLGLAAIALYPVQMVLIPKLQIRVNQLAKQRVRTARRLSDRIGEAVSGIQEIHVNDTSAFELANISRWLGRIFDIRYELYKRKYFIKFLNNFIAQLTPFFFYSLGGVLVINQKLSFGALVAVIAAYKDLSPPWKELLRHYQTAMDAKIKYEQLIDQFQVEDLLPKELQKNPPATMPVIEGDFEAAHVTVEDDSGFPTLDGVTVKIPLRGSTAVLGASDSGREDLMRLIVRLINASKGLVRLGGHNLETLHEAVIGRYTAYVDHSAYVFNGTIADNLLYGLKHHPVRSADYDDEARIAHEHFRAEARLAGNTTDDIADDWVEYSALGFADKASASAHIHDILRLVELEEDIHEFGLQARLDPNRQPATADKLLLARKKLSAVLQQPECRQLVEPFDRKKYNNNLSVGENIVMGRPLDGDTDFATICNHDHMRAVLEKNGMTRWFVETGLKVADTMVELFADLPPGHEFFDRYSFIEAADLPDFQAIIRKAESAGIDELEDEEKTRLQALTFMLIPARHRLDFVTDGIRNKLLRCRESFAADLPGSLRKIIAFYDRDHYNPAASVRDNILFGKVEHGRANAREKIGQIIRKVISDLGLHEVITELGYDQQVGVAGSRLSPVLRQKLCLARALVKQPRLLVLINPLSSLDPDTQDRMARRILERFSDQALIWVINRPALAMHFSYVLVMKDGRVVESGSPPELLKKGQLFHDMVPEQS